MASWKLQHLRRYLQKDSHAIFERRGCSSSPLKRSIPDQKEAPESNQVGSSCPRLTWVIAFWLAVASNRRVCCWRKRSANWLAHDALELLGLGHVAEPLNQLQAPQVKMPRSIGGITEYPQEARKDEVSATPPQISTKSKIKSKEEGML